MQAIDSKWQLVLRLRIDILCNVFLYDCVSFQEKRVNLGNTFLPCFIAFLSARGCQTLTFSKHLFMIYSISYYVSTINTFDLNF